MPTTRSKAARKNGVTNHKQSTNTPKTRKRTDKSKTPATKSKPDLLESVAESCLFKLPPELRNTIYRFAIVADNEVSITKAGGIPEPGLLSVCKIVRSEAFGTFYQENKFSCVVDDYDPASVMLAMRRASRHFSTPIGAGGIDDFSLRCSLSPHWKNLVQWLRLCNQGLCSGYGYTEPHGVEQTMVAGLFGAMKAVPNMTPYCLDKFLKSMRPVLVYGDARWGKD